MARENSTLHGADHFVDSARGTPFLGVVKPHLRMSDAAFGVLLTVAMSFTLVCAFRPHKHRSVLGDCDGAIR
jgi:hypothetical protein